MPGSRQHHAYKSPRGSVLRTPATLTGIRTFRPLRGPVLIPVVLRNGYRPAESKLSPDGNHPSGTYIINKKKEDASRHPLKSSPSDESIFNLNDLFLVVRSASLTYSVRYHQLTAFTALHKCRTTHLPIRSAAVPSRLRGFILRANRHLAIPPILPKLLRQRALVYYRYLMRICQP